MLHMGMDKAAGAQAQRRAAGDGRHPARGRAPRRLSAPVLRRHAPARDDRHGAVLQPAAADRRRADHRPGRDDPGADRRPGQAPARRDRAWRSSGSRTTWASSPGWPTACIVMYAGFIVEEAPVKELYANPRHPYTLGCWARCRAWTQPGRIALTSIEGLPPDLIDLPEGCPFCARCTYRIEQCCDRESHRLSRSAPGHEVACWVDVTRRSRRRRRRQERRYERQQQHGTNLLEVRDLKMYFPDHAGGPSAPGGRRQGRRWPELSTSSRARRWAWWASRAAASRPPGGRSCSSTSRPPGQVLFEGS